MYSPPSVQVSVGDGRVVLVRTLQVDALGDVVHRAVQNPALLGAFAQHRLDDGAEVAVVVVHHAANLQTGRRGTRQTVDRADLRLKRLALPDLIPRRP